MALSKIFDRSIQRIATWNSREKIKTTIPREQNYTAWLVKNGTTVSSKLTRKICSSVSSEQATRRPGKQALGLQFFILRILDNFQLLGCDFSETEPNLEN